MAPYLYMIVIVSDFVCYDYGVWRMIAIPGNADKRMSGSVCEARDRQAQKQNNCANPRQEVITVPCIDPVTRHSES